ncbi:MAG TPA: hypothetical protein VGJ95_06000 [Pseudonocardiaceae bacterium]
MVQLVTGLADEARTAIGTDRPVPLPAQAIDYLTGWLLAAGIAEALRRRASDGGGWHAETVLARTAHWLDDLGRIDGLGIPEPGQEVADRLGGADRPARSDSARRLRRRHRPVPSTVDYRTGAARIPPPGCGDRQHARPNRRTRATEPANTRDRTGEHARPNRRTRRFGQWYG